jgi:hypothetical protein
MVPDTGKGLVRRKGSVRASPKGFRHPLIEAAGERREIRHARKQSADLPVGNDEARVGPIVP